MIWIFAVVVTLAAGLIGYLLNWQEEIDFRNDSLENDD